ncbi:MAG: 4Fe-4S binding protein [Chloroflexi bacterium]|nr:4Fe-4S binding protein [Chloroflexota bacterium]
MAMFIRVEVDPQVAGQADLVKKLVEVCPVDIFATGQDGALAIVEQNLDECTLCDLCIQACPPGTVKVVKLYE